MGIMVLMIMAMLIILFKCFITFLSVVYRWIRTPSTKFAPLNFRPTHVNVAYVVPEVVSIITNRLHIIKSCCFSKSNFVVDLSCLVSTFGHFLSVSKNRFINPIIIVKFHS
jgi:hypothetical protein